MRRRIAYPALLGFVATGLYVAQVQPVETSLLSSRVRHTEDRAWPSARVLFVGDMSFDRTVRTFGERKGFEKIFECSKATLRSFDAVVGNLEGPITTQMSVSLGTVPGMPGNTQFTFPADIAKVLAEHNFKAVSIANNHIRDFGPDGVVQTRAYLDEAGLAYVGDPGDETTLSKTVVINSVPIVLVAFNQFLGGNLKDKVAATVAEIQKYEPEDRVVVFAHWGDEYLPFTDQQKRWAHAFVEAGADLIIGAHPHIIQDQEVHNGVPIFYSLGNFIFDQYWQPDVRDGLGVGVTFGRNGVESLETMRFVRDTTPEPCLVAPVEMSLDNL
jgi:poly-gamma-glutamate synthesis protein (capsule biosynthesis protein)